MPILAAMPKEPQTPFGSVVPNVVAGVVRLRHAFHKKWTAHEPTAEIVF